MAITRGGIAAAVRIVGVLSFLLLHNSCQRAAKDPVTVSYFRLGWSQPDELPTANTFAAKFVEETGIQLKNLPVPESTLDQLDLSRNLLQGGSGVDVLGIDVVWPGVLATDLMDLGPDLASEIDRLEPSLLPMYTVGGKVVAIPFGVQLGALEYRADLLAEYGYDHPPETWDELEAMAKRIQKGERAKGKKEFWGYVWQGADAEALTCNALEWQAGEGGGRIIEDNGAISVNNAGAIRSWERAKRWIGSISPPSVLAYRESDSAHIFESGGAAFERVWVGVSIARGGGFRQIYWQAAPTGIKVGYANLPSGPKGGGGSLGGAGLAVSRRSVHPQQAIELVRYLVRAELQYDEQEERSPSPEMALSHRLPISAALDPGSRSAEKPYRILRRPSSISGNRYDQVTKLYISSVHAALSGKRSAPQAAAALEKQLVAITGLHPGPPAAD